LPHRVLLSVVSCFDGLRVKAKFGTHGQAMKRREFIALVGGMAAAWPLAVRAQQPMPVLGFLNSTSPQAWAPFLAAFLQGLKQAGYVNGQNVLIEYRWAGNQNERLPTLAAELVRRPVSLMVTSGGDHVVLAAKETVPAIPIVSTFGFDPVASRG
jgi:putative ABC transport system substrate-binding protein